MPSCGERRVIEFFCSAYNSVKLPKISQCLAGPEQEAPDAILSLSNGIRVSLELTSAFRPSSTYTKRGQGFNYDLTPIQRVLDRKLLNTYKEYGTDEVWLVMHLLRTLPKGMVEESLSSLKIPDTYDRIYLSWPVPLGIKQTGMGLLELPTRLFWLHQSPAA